MQAPSSGLVLQRSLPEWGSSVSLGHISSESCPVVVKVVESEDAGAAEVAAGRKCASLGPCGPNLESAWAESVAVARSQSVLAPLSSVQHPAGAAVLFPWIGPLLKIPSGGLSVIRALEICRDVGTAVGHCHCQRHLHLGVNPSNIVIDEATQRGVLIDFSMSRVLPCKGCTPGAVLGYSPTHSAPEQTGRVGIAVDFRSDLYSIGVTLYQMLTGELPYKPARESVDALMNAHVALEPTPLPSKVPPVVRAVVSKLLAKDMDARYSSARSLVDDLEAILKAGVVGFSGMILNTPPHHMSLRWLDGLYGCDAEAKVVLDYFLAAEDGNLDRTTVVSLVGLPGAGKSSLMQEAFAKVSSRKDTTLTLCMGKFAQHKRNPYSAISVCLTDFLAKVRRMPVAHAGHLRRLLSRDKKFMRHASELVKINEDFVVFAEQVTGLPRVDAEATDTVKEGVENLAIAFRYVMDVFYSKAWLPVVFFLDDMQWADEASLAFLKELLMLDGTPILMFNSFRVNEVTVTHPFAVLRSFLREQDDVIRVEDVTLRPWNNIVTMQALLGKFGYETRHLNLNGLDEEAQRSAVSKVVEGTYTAAELVMLSEFLCRLASGNPFFTIMLVRGLVDDSVLHYSWEARRWTWSMANLGSSKYCDNIIEFLLAGMSNLPITDQQVLLILAVLGEEIPLGLLCDVIPKIVSKKIDPSNTSAGVELLWPLIDLGFITMSLPITVDSKVSFVHDQIGESALHLSTVAERDIVRMLLAKHIFQLLKIPILSTDEAYLPTSSLEVDEASLESLKMPAVAPKLFLAAVEHLTKVSYRLSQRAAIAVLARYAVLCAQFLYGNLSFRRSADFYAASLELEEHLLGGEWFTAQGPLRIRLWQTKYAEAQSLSKSLFFDEADARYISCEEHSCTQQQLLEVILVRCKMATVREKYEEAVSLGLRAAASADIQIDPDISEDAALEYIHKNLLRPMAASKAAGKGLLGALPRFKEDAFMELLDRILEATTGAAFLCGKLALYALLPAAIIVRAMESGTSTAATLNALAMLGDSLAAIYGLRREGCELAIEGGIKKYNELMGSAVSEYDACRYNHAALAQHWSDSLEPALEWFDISFERGLKVGDFVYCCYSRCMHLCFCMESSMPLADIIKYKKERMPFIRKCGLTDMQGIMEGVFLAAALMAGGDAAPSNAMLTKFESRLAQQSLFSQCGALVYMMLGYYLSGRYTDARRVINLIDGPMIDSCKGFVQHLEYHWIFPVVSSELSQIGITDDEQRVSDYSRIRECEIELASYSMVAPKLWRAKHLLVRAHLLRAMANYPGHVNPPKSHEVLAAFEAAAAAAVEDGMLQVGLLAYIGAMVICGNTSPPLVVPQTSYALLAHGLADKWGARSALELLKVDAATHALLAPAVIEELESEEATTADESDQYSESNKSFRRGGSTSSGSSCGSLDSAVGEVAAPAGVSYKAINGLLDLHQLLEASIATSESLTAAEVHVKFVEALQQLTGASTVLVIWKKRPSQANLKASVGGMASMVKYHVVAEWNGGQLSVKPRELNTNLEPAAVLCRTIQSKTFLVIDDVKVDPRLAKGGTLADPYFQNALATVKSAISLPLLSAGRAIGAVYVEQSDVTGAFSGAASKLQLLTTQLEMAIKRSNSFDSVQAKRVELEKQNRELLSAYTASSRFVPVEVIALLRKRVVKLRAGHVSELNATVLVADVPAISRAYGGKDSLNIFKFFQGLAATLIDPITRNHGALKNQLGDGPMMAVFNSSGDAVKAAMGLQTVARNYISTLVAGDQSDFQLTIGLSTGPTIVGCLGTSARINVTVAGASAMIAQALQEKAEVLTAVTILADEATLRSALSELDANALPQSRRMGNLAVDGVGSAIIYELFENRKP